MTEIPVRNPRTGAVDYAFTEPSINDLEHRLSRLRRNQTSWRSWPVKRRGEVLEQFASALDTHCDRLVDVLSTDTGRWNLSIMEVKALQAITRSRISQAEHVLETRRTKSPHINVSHLQVYVPYSTVAVISPWNYPLILSFLDAVPALLAGCSVIIKPSEITPRFIRAVKELLAGIPELDAVVDIVAGTSVTGQRLIAMSDAINFTGSTDTGRSVAQASAKHLKPVFLELGGKDPAVVLESADLERSANAIMHCAIVNTGQACFSIERIYVHESLATDFIDALCSLAEQASLNTEGLKSGTIGPFISPKQALIVEEQLADAKLKGAKFLTGGVIEHHGGSWLRPTVVKDVNHSMLLMRKETFAPILPVMTFINTSEALRLANDSEYGLSAAVFGEESDMEKVGLALEVGGVYCNDVDLIGSAHESAEKMGFKNSGLGGSRYGPEGVTRFTRKQSLVFQHGQSTTIDDL